MKVPLVLFAAYHRALIWRGKALQAAGDSGSRRVSDNPLLLGQKRAQRLVDQSLPNPLKITLTGLILNESFTTRNNAP